MQRSNRDDQRPLAEQLAGMSRAMRILNLAVLALIVAGAFTFGLGWPGNPVPAVLLGLAVLLVLVGTAMERQERRPHR